jgi:hypothetical protein
MGALLKRYGLSVTGNFVPDEPMKHDEISEVGSVEKLQNGK